jgi:hypothetical protein
MKNMKGFIFTVDAVFSLIVASAAIGILIYAYFSQPVLSYQTTSSEAYSILQSFSTTPLSQIARSSVYIAAAVNASSGSASEWPYFATGGGMDSATDYGAVLPQLLFLTQADNVITSPAVASSGLVVFSAGNSIYAINATKGYVVLNRSFSTDPMYPIIFDNMILYANESGYIDAINYTGGRVWNSTKLPAIPDTPLTVDNNYVALGAGDYIALINPLNGAVVATADLGGFVQTPSYGHGEYLAVTTGNGVGAYGYLHSLALNGGTLTPLWSYQLSDSPNTYTPAIGSNFIAVTSGGNLNVLTLGGNVLWHYSTTNNIIVGSPAVSNGEIFVMDKYSLYNFNATTGNLVWHIINIGINYQNVTPSVTPYDIYVVTNQTLFRAYNINNQSFDINIQFPTKSTLQYDQVALAYGNAYVVWNNTVYAYGTCRDYGTDSVLSAIAKMYFEGEGGCANLILNASYQNSDVGIFINGSYAPALHLATFNGKNSAVYSLSSPSVKENYSVSMWFYLNKGSPIFDLYHGTKNGGIGSGQGFEFAGGWAEPYNRTPSYFSWAEDLPTSPQFCNTSVGTIKPGAWYNVVVSVLKYSNVTIYINGNESKNCNFGIAARGIADEGIGIGVNPTSTFGVANGTIAGIQLYNGNLSQSQAYTLSSEGIAGIPVVSSGLELIGWWPLEGDADSYAGTQFSNLGYPYNITYASLPFQPASLAGAYQISAASVPMGLGTSSNSLYNVSVVVWR